jgi:putative peptidoglycan lipid II flippase
MFLLALPASVGLIVLARPIVSLLFERGEFNALTAQMTAWALVWYAAGLVGHSIMEVLTRAYFAQHDTRTPVIIGAIAMGLNVLFSFLFSAWFQRIGWLPLGGLALANSLATALEATALFVFMRRRLNGIEGKHLASGFVRCAGAVLGMAIGLWLWLQVTGGMSRWIVALGGVALGGILYLAGVAILRVPEIQLLIGMVTRRLHRSPSS